MDQFASKVIEKCLKIGGSEFLDRYLARVCTGRPDRPRMPLIDSKQSGSHDPYVWRLTDNQLLEINTAIT